MWFKSDTRADTCFNALTNIGTQLLGNISEKVTTSTDQICTNNLTSRVKKCRSKLECLIYEMLLIKERRPTLNTQADPIRAKLFILFFFTVKLLYILNSNFIICIWKWRQDDAETSCSSVSISKMFFDFFFSNNFVELIGVSGTRNGFIILLSRSCEKKKTNW